MECKISYIYVPVQDLNRALAFYRDKLGLVESWREGDVAAAFQLPGTEIQLMIHIFEEEMPSGPIFQLPSVDAFYKELHEGVHFKAEPITVPGGGRWVAAYDTEGNSLYFIDSGQ